ncbi:hypothetical protein ACOME3_009630 [Neoechinorhynchus agilis]
MLEARLIQGSILKKLLDSIHPPITDATWDCETNGVHLQAMDNCHTTLVSLMLRSDGFENYRCDRRMSLSMNLHSMSKILKCAGTDDAITLRADEEKDSVTFIFESPNGERICEYELKLMDLAGEHLSIPDKKYQCKVKMPSAEFSRIIKDLSSVGETVQIDCMKDKIRYSCKGDLASGNITLAQNCSIDKDDDSIIIQTNEQITLTFSLKYLMYCTKASSLSTSVSMCMSTDTPLMVEYKIADIGYIRYFMAPKIEEDMDED